MLIFNFYGCNFLYVSNFANVNAQLVSEYTTSIKKKCIYCIYRENFVPGLFFAPFALWPEGKFKTGLIELYVKDYVRKLQSERMQDCSLRSEYDEYKTGWIQWCIRYMFPVCKRLIFGPNPKTFLMAMYIIVYFCHINIIHLHFIGRYIYHNYWSWLQDSNSGCKRRESEATDLGYGRAREVQDNHVNVSYK